VDKLGKKDVEVASCDISFLLNFADICQTVKGSNLKVMLHRRTVHVFCLLNIHYLIHTSPAFFFIPSEIFPEVRVRKKHGPITRIQVGAVDDSFQKQSLQ
jgi:hypothetical protein